MSVYRKTIGTGQHIVLLHGWGMHAGIWTNLANELVQSYQLTLVDLPGYGNSKMTMDNYNLDTLCKEIARLITRPVILLGWSLGGMIAQQLALNLPEQITKLILVTSTAQFYRSADWPEAMKPEVLDNFANSLIDDYETTIKQFLALQVQGSKDERKVLRELQAQLESTAKPELSALLGGLNILRKANLRPSLNRITCPVLSVYGQHDRLVPAAVGPYMADFISNYHNIVIDKAGHAPFLSHSDEFIRYLKAFIDGR